MTLERYNNNDKIIKYGSLQFNSFNIRQEYGKNIIFKKYTYYNKELFIDITNTKCLIIYEQHKYSFKNFIRPKVPSKIKQSNDSNDYFNKLILYDKAMTNYLNEKKDYIIKDEGGTNILSHLEVWKCCNKECKFRIVLDGIKKHIISDWYENINHIDDNHQINKNYMESRIRDAILESYVILNINKQLKDIYDCFNDNMFNIIDKKLLLTHYNESIKKKIYHDN